MKSILWIISAVIADMVISACSPVNSLQPFDDAQADKLVQENYVKIPARHMISIVLPPDQKWKKIIMPMENGGMVMMIPAGENETQPSQSIKTMLVSKRAHPAMTAEKLVQLEFERAGNDCKQIGPEIIEKSSQFISYRLDKTGCHEQPEMKEIGKAFNGGDGVYVVWYSAMKNKVSGRQFSLISRVISAAQLVNDPRAAGS